MRMPKTLGLSLALLVASSVAMAKQNPSSHHQTGVSSKAKPAPHAKMRSANKVAEPRRSSAKRNVAHRSRGTVRRMAALPAADEYIGPVRINGQRQVGRAAWYGNQHVGRRTSSGEPLDTVRATAAHRSLPLHSLARVTNLKNGRSVVVRINDRGPVSRSLLIDMSPRAAAAIDMINAGIAEVMVEPVAFAGGIGDSSAR
jgi:peptidoglycan lytic transglycosylase